MTTIERKIINKLINNLLTAGFSLTVHDGEEVILRRSTNHRDVLNALGTVDEESILVHRPNTTPAMGSVFLVYNGDDTVICDYTTNLETYIPMEA